MKTSFRQHMRSKFLAKGSPGQSDFKAGRFWCSFEGDYNNYQEDCWLCSSSCKWRWASISVRRITKESNDSLSIKDEDPRGDRFNSFQNDQLRNKTKIGHDRKNKNARQIQFFRKSWFLESIRAGLRLAKILINLKYCSDLNADQRRIWSDMLFKTQTQSKIRSQIRDKYTVDKKRTVS